MGGRQLWGRGYRRPCGPPGAPPHRGGASTGAEAEPERRSAFWDTGTGTVPPTGPAGPEPVHWDGDRGLFVMAKISGSFLYGLACGEKHDEDYDMSPDED
ncbi:hypothetical protein EYF80_053343 [Liparis tanakae]|uniref:Uncharacterized protein n=1 Tax=Liparis tanakae TaxID=230148 RepID=A0A4Z2F5X5_9TELE|nr:hypothetical protein EYF80_053343 [Liparis tanakae]